MLTMAGAVSSSERASSVNLQQCLEENIPVAAMQGELPKRYSHRERERVQTELSLHNMHEQQNALGAREDLTVQ